VLLAEPCYRQGMTSAPPPPSGVEFRLPQRARHSLAGLGDLLDAGTVDALGAILRQTPDPDLALERLQRFARSSPAALAEIRDSRRSLQAALVVFSHSNFLYDTLTRHPELLSWALEPDRIYDAPTAQELRSELGVLSPSLDDEQAAAALARFRRMHLLRIALRDLLGAAPLAEITLELSNLADALLEGAHDHVRADLVRRFGRPLVRAGEVEIEGRFVAIALGKLGGRELNYSSDVDLMYLHTGQGETSGPVRTSNHDFYQQLATRLTGLLCKMTPEGFSYRVDLRLRPEGSSGELVASLEGAVAYYDKRARDWELQMLIKARPAAGDLRMGESFLRMVRPLIYKTTTDFSLIERVSESRDRIQQHRRRAGKGETDVKLERGGIRDIEFLVQCLQRLHGGHDPFVRSGGTLFALHRLREKDYLTLPDYAALSSAYQYLRTVEHTLQLLDDRQVHQLPRDEEARDLLARKLSAAAVAADLEHDLEGHFQSVAAIYERTIHAQSVSETIASDIAGTESSQSPPKAPIEKTWLRQLRQIEMRSPELAQELDRLPIRRGAQIFEHFLDTVASTPELADRLEASPELVACVGDLIEHCPYLGERLARYPLDVAELAGVEADGSVPSDQPSDLFAELDQRTDLAPLFDATVAYNEKSMLLRRFYRRRNLRILAESVHGGQPIFHTLARMSELAEWVIRAAYRIAYQAQLGYHLGPPPATQLHVIALGRLGIREFDLGSDADLVFVLPDEGEADEPFWRDFVARFIEVISNYTREGRIFTVDARLRPNGRDGAIVQTAAAVKRYFAEHADPWEALAYMKARTVAGDLEGGRRFLMELQEVGWERFGKQADLTKMLRDMRGRIEKEQGPAAPLKAGPGGYFDIDFILLYLRLKSAGVFFEILSTPKRISIVRDLGGLTDEQAGALHQAAVFFRSFDHAVRAATGRPSGEIPAAVGTQESVCELLGRWSAIHPDAQPLPAVVERVRRSTRAIYREVFAG
jgi:glutamate-ammonia-ligase adenylyltransferase